MLLYLQKLLTAFVMPLGLVFGLLTLSLVWRLKGWRRGETLMLVTAIVLLWVMSIPVVGVAMIGALESSHRPIPVKDAPVSDVIIVLGGLVEPAAPPRVVPELREGVDRLTYAALLFAAGKAPQILLSSGGADPSTGTPPEAENMAEVLTWLGVPRSAIVLETKSLTTHENALFTAEMWRARGYRTGLLVTSASHMRRANLEFRCAGLDLTPAPADVWVSDYQKNWNMQWMPNPAMLLWTTVALKEYLGLVVAGSRPCPAPASPKVEP